MSNVKMYQAITNIRILATLVIVAFHCSCPYTVFEWNGYVGGAKYLYSILHFIFQDFLCNTMLPSFFLISGMLFYTKKEQYRDRMKTFWRKFDRLVVPYALFFCFCSFISIPPIGYGGFSGHIWFLEYLFLFFCISLLCYNIKEHILFIIGLICFLLYSMQSRLCLDLEESHFRLLYYYVFFISGFYASHYFTQLRESRWLKWIFILVWGVALYLHSQTLFTLLFNIVLLSIVPVCNISNKHMLYINQQSFRIYLLHHIIFFLLFSIPTFKWLYANYATIAIGTMFCCVLTLTLLCCKVLDKIEFKYF